ncbi:MAG: hypothetical protein GX780_06945 [Campylobacteraceae bacterium]|nr:hypothetical protein [Campylobacteraceae bacterium]
MSCCSVTFSNRNELGGFISLSRSWVGIFFTIVAVFYAFIGILGMLYVRFRLWFGVTSVAYVIVGLFFIVYTVSPYVYELPTHTCPFCIIQKEYNYIGYAFYITLLLGGFFGLRSGFSELFLGYDGRKDIGWALGFGAIFVILSLRYTLGYYLINGVWL